MNSLSLKNKQNVHVEEKLVSLEKHAPQADVLARGVGHNVLPLVIAKIATMDMVLDQHHLQQGGGRTMIPKDSQSVMKHVGESILQGHLTMFERILLNTMISYFILHGFGITEDNLLSVYNKIAHRTDVVKGIECDAPITNRRYS